MILNSPNNFGRAQIIFDRSILWKISPGKSNLNLIKMIWTRPRLFVLDQNILHRSKTIWTVHKDKALIDWLASDIFSSNCFF